MRKQSVIFLALILASCVNLDAPIDPTRFFVLNGPGVEAVDVAPGLNAQVVELAPHLSTPRMVVRVSANEIRYSDVNRWAAPLGESIKTTLNSYLSVATDAAGSPSNLSAGALRLVVHRFEGYLPDKVHLLVTWVLVDSDSREVMRQRSEHLIPGWDGQDYEELAVLLESAVAALAEEIVGTVN